MAPRGNVPHDDFKSPSRQSGNQAIKGTSVAPPAAPAKPATVSGLTPFLMGVRAGLQSAGTRL